MEREEARPGGPVRAYRPPWEPEDHDPTRLLALSDGVFAFAMTLLVLGLALPSGFNPARIGAVLAGLHTAILAYLLSFFVIFFYWLAHNQIFRYFVRFDGVLVRLNEVFLLFIAVLPFVTNLLAAASTEAYAVVVYAFVQCAAGAVVTAMWVYATQGHRLIPPEIPSEWIRYVTTRTLLSPVLFAASIPVAFWNPVYAEYSWFGVFVFQAALRRSAPKRLGRAPSAEPRPAVGVDGGRT